MKNVFIIGCPRSGTSILGRLPAARPDVVQWVEPYFVWDRYFRDSSDDERCKTDCTPEVRKQIVGDFKRFFRRYGAGCEWLVDKSPRNCLKIPFIMELFPEARFIHILRDGRDTVLSMHREWNRLKRILDDRKKRGTRYDKQRFMEIANHLKNQNGISYMFRSFWHETGGSFRKDRHLNLRRWGGEIGFGPRFKNWRDIYDSVSSLEFSAHQWVACIRKIDEDRALIPDGRFKEIRYERLIQTPDEVLREIEAFLGLSAHKKYDAALLTEIRSDNMKKWRTQFSEEQLNRILPVLRDELKKKGML